MSCTRKKQTLMAAETPNACSRLMPSISSKTIIRTAVQAIATAAFQRRESERGGLPNGAAKPWTSGRGYKAPEELPAHAILLLSRKGPTAGYAGSDDTSSAVRR